MSVRFLLDTNICIYIAKRHPPEVASRFENLRPGDVGMSIITYGELLFGAEKSQHPQPAKEPHRLPHLLRSRSIGLDTEPII